MIVSWEGTSNVETYSPNTANVVKQLNNHHDNKLNTRLNCTPYGTSGDKNNDNMARRHIVDACLMVLFLAAFER